MRQYAVLLSLFGCFSWESAIGGRSIGFGLERIAIYPEGDKAARARALDLKTSLPRPEIE